MSATSNIREVLDRDRLIHFRGAGGEWDARPRSQFLDGVAGDDILLVCGESAGLVVDLLDHKHQPRVFVLNPRLSLEYAPYAMAYMTKSPGVVVMRGRRCAHTVEDRERGQYTFLAGRAGVEAHPTILAFEFLGGAGPADEAVLRAIDDYRWFADPAHPGRSNRLFEFFRPRQAAGRTPAQTEAVFAAVERHLSTPANAWLAPVARRDDARRRLQRACRRYLRFVRLVWEQAFAPSGRTVFDPLMFFGDEALAARYRGGVRRRGIADG